MQNKIVELFSNYDEILVPIKYEKKVNYIAYYYNYVNFKNIEKVQKIIKSIQILLNTKVDFKFTDGIFELDVEYQQKSLLYFENYFTKIPKNENYILLGVDDNNNPVYRKIEKIKSILVAGTSGSGKSNLLHQIIMSTLLCNKDIYLCLIDMKATEFNRYNMIYKSSNRLILKVATNFKNALKSIVYISCIVDDRLKKMKKKNERFSSEKPILFVIDECAQLFTTRKEKEGINNYISKIGALGRAANVYLVLATQYPNNDNIENVIRVNLQSRIALKCMDVHQSQNILGTSGAEELTNPGDMIIWIDGENKTKCRSTYLSDEFLDRFFEINS